MKYKQDDMSNFEGNIKTALFAIANELNELNSNIKELRATEKQSMESMGQAIGYVAQKIDNVVGNLK